MALFLSSIVTAASGSVGGLTFSHNSGGMYVRGRSTPTNPATARQTAVRTALGAANQSWDLDLTDDQQNAWNTYGKETPVTNALGSVVHRSGHAMYTRQYVPAIQIGVAPSFTAPLTNNTGQPVMETFDFGIKTVTLIEHINLRVEIAGGETADAIFILYLGRAQNHGRRFYKGPYQFADTIGMASGDTEATFVSPITDLTSDYPFSVGMFIPYKVNVLYADGRFAQEFTALQEVKVIT